MRKGRKSSAIIAYNSLNRQICRLISKKQKQSLRETNVISSACVLRPCSCFINEMHDEVIGAGFNNMNLTSSFKNFILFSRQIFFKISFVVSAQIMSANKSLGHLISIDNFSIDNPRSTKFRSKKTVEIIKKYFFSVEIKKNKKNQSTV